MTITVHGFEFDPATLPQIIRDKALERYLAHKLGNEVDAAIVAKVRSKDGLNDPKASSDAVSAWREANAEVIETWVNSRRAVMVDAILAGTVGTREGGPRKDPVEVRFHALVAKELLPILKALGYKKKTLVMDANVSDAHGNTRTVQHMFNTMVNMKGEALRAQAEKEIAAESRAAARKQQEAGKANLAELGF